MAVLVTAAAAACAGFALQSGGGLTIGAHCALVLVYTTCAAFMDVGLKALASLYMPQALQGPTPRCGKF